jgi:RHS repeat-associated protein
MYTNYYFLTGVNYSVMGVIDAYNTNALAEAYEYDPYGRHRVIDPGTDATYFTSDDTYDELHPGAINNAIRYTGQRFDAESGLMYYKNRYYDPGGGEVYWKGSVGVGGYEGRTGMGMWGAASCRRWRWIRWGCTLLARRPDGLSRIRREMRNHGYFNRPHEIEAFNLANWFRNIALPCVSNGGPQRDLFSQEKLTHDPHSWE